MVVAAATLTLNRKYEELKKERDARVQRVEDLIARARAYAKIPGRRARHRLEPGRVAPVAERRQPLFVQANNEGDIREAVAFADRANIRIVITGGLESPLAAPLLKEKNIPVILGSVLTMPAREDAHHAATYRAAGELAQAGVTFAFGTGGAANNRLLPYEAAISVAWGLDRNRALRAITLDAATILGVADRVGSLEPGKIANLFIATGDPMEMKTQFTHIFINGTERRAEEQAHRALRTVLVAAGGGEVMRRDALLNTKDTKGTKAFWLSKFWSSCASCSSC